MATDQIEQPAMVAPETTVSEAPVRLRDQRSVSRIEQLDPPGKLVVTQEQRVRRKIAQGAGSFGFEHVDSHGPSMLRAVPYHKDARKGSVMSLVPYDDRDGFIWMNGSTVPWRDAKVHVLTHALHY